MNEQADSNSFEILQKELHEANARISKLEEELINTTSRSRTSHGFDHIKESFHHLSSSIPNGGVMIFDRKLRYILAEGPGLKRLGFGDEDVVGKMVYELLPTPDSEKLAQLQQMALTGISSTEEYSNGQGDFFFQFHPLTNTKGFIDAGMLFFQEITQLKKTQQALEQKLAEQDRLAVAIYHDLSTPIRSIVSFSQLIEKHNSHQLDVDGTIFLNHVIREGIRLEVMLKGLLSYIQLNEKAKSEEISLYQVIANVIVGMYHSTINKKVNIQYLDLPSIKGDFMEFQVLFGNLIQNSIHFNVSEEILIHISAFREKNSWVFSVKDNGVGIDKDHQKVIFSLFNRSQPQYKHLGGGFGLPICKKIIKKRGGEIWVESEPDEGTTIYFSLPDKLPETY
ncbi:ATP-binding protein [bacterium]|nr:ATP-binding protein [bacterium]